MARDLKDMDNSVVAVIGDGAMTSGQAYEAMNNAGYLDSNMIVILNDNNQVSFPTANLDGPTPPVGALSSALSRLQSNLPLRELRQVAKASNNTFLLVEMNKLCEKIKSYTYMLFTGSDKANWGISAQTSFKGRRVCSWND